MSDSIEAIFTTARSLNEAERSVYLDEACGGDAGLRAEVEALLVAEVADIADAAGVADGADMNAGSSLRSVESDPDATLRHDSSRSESETPAETAGQVIGKYTLLQPIGEGGFGTVWMAAQKEPVKRRVALKIIKLGMDTKQVIARFEAERQALAMMDHPNIAKVFDAGSTETGRPFFVMELVKGVPILEYCDTEKLNTKARLDLFVKVCRAIQHAHQKGIIHRDIKPGNVLVTLHDGAPAPKVIDFGIAKATNQALTEKTLYTQQHQMIGTPAYMSPEQAEMSGLDIDTRSDIYSLGVLLYELLTGTTPFAHQELMERGFAEMMRIIREETPHKPSTRLSSLGETSTRTAEQRHTDIKKLGLVLRGDLDWIVMKCLEKDRTRRYDTANGLAADIERHLSDEPVVAGPPSAAYKMRKFVKRNRAGVLAGTTIAAVLVLGVIGTSTGMVWALNEKDRADAAAESERQATVAAQQSEQRAIGETERAERERDRAAEAEAQTAQRADELQQVSDFQAEQLGKIEPELMGIKLRRALIDGAPEDRQQQVEQSLSGINFTNIALNTLEENIFSRTIEAIDSQFADQPLVQANMLQSIASTLTELGLYDLASDPHQRALEIHRRELGDDDPGTLVSVYNMGFLLKSQGQLTKAEPYYREALEGRRRVLGNDHPNTLHSIGSIGSLLAAQGKLTKAEPYAREALEGQRRVLGDDHPDTLISINNMGQLMNDQGEHTKAESYYREAIEGYRRVHGEDHPNTIGLIGNLGVLLQDQGKFTEAEPYLRDTLEARRRVLGDDHPHTLLSVGNMGYLLKKQGKLTEAEPFLLEALEARRRVLGNDHPGTLVSINSMGLLLYAQGKLSEVEPYFLESLEARRRVLGADHPATLRAIGNMGGLLSRQGKLAEAEPYLRKASEERRRILGDDHPSTLISINNLGILLARQGKLTEAEPHLREALEGSRRVLGDDHPETLYSANSMGGFLLKQERFSEAEPYLREALEGSRRVLGDDHPDTLDSIGKMALLLQAQDKLTEAESYVREALEGKRRVLGDEHLDTLASIDNYGNLLNELGRFDEALELLKRGEPAARTASADAPDSLSSYLNELGHAQTGLGQFSEAETTLLEAFALRNDNFGPDDARTQTCITRLADLYTAWETAEPDNGYDTKAEEWRGKLTLDP